MFTKTNYIFIVSLLFCINSICATAQVEWAPIGAKWYNTHQSGDIPGLVEYFTYESVKDTMVGDKDCRKLEIYYYAKDNEPIYWGMELLHQDEEKVYTYHSGDFHILYDFSLVVGDTLESYILNSVYPSYHNPESVPRRFFYTVKVIGDTLIDGVALKYQKLEGLHIPDLSDFYHFWIGGKVIEKIGSLVMLLGEISPRVEMPPWWGPLRCYEDNEISFKTNTDLACDTIYNYTSVPIINNDFEARLYPNPACNEINLDLQRAVNFTVEVVDALGQIWFTKDFRGIDSCRIPISGLKNGFFFIRVRVENCRPFTLRFTKNS